MADAAGHHRGHDRLVVAAAADRGVRLRDDLVSCTACDRLFSELVAVRAAVPFAMIPARPRAFTLSAAQASRLRADGWGRLRDVFATQRDALSRPLALAFTTLGLAGILLTAAPGLAPIGATPAASDPTTREMRVDATSTPADVPRPGVGGPGEAAPLPSDAASTTARIPMLVVSGSFLAIGAGLFAARAQARGRRSVR